MKEDLIINGEKVLDTPYTRWIKYEEDKKNRNKSRVPDGEASKEKKEPSE
jgi:hypothetical protein